MKDGHVIHVIPSKQFLWLVMLFLGDNFTSNVKQIGGAVEQPMDRWIFFDMVSEHYEYRVQAKVLMVDTSVGRSNTERDLFQE